MKTFLTRSGILAQANDKGNGSFYAAFFSNSGEFRRECTIEEFEYLESILQEIQIPKNEIWKRICDAFGNFPVWHKIATITVVDDYSNYEAGRSCNGGNYSYHTTQEWFAALVPTSKGREWKFRRVDSFSTSAEFCYDKLSGSFQQDLGQLVVTNCSYRIAYRTQTGRNEDGYLLDEYKVLEQISEEGTFADLWNKAYTCIEKKEEDGYECMALRLSDKKALLKELKELGWERPNKTILLSKGRRN